MLRACKLLLCLLFLPLSAGLIACGVSTSGTFTLALDQSAVSLAQGATTTVSVTATGSSSFRAQVYVAVDGLPAGITISPANATIASGATQQFTLSAGATAPASNATVVFSGTSGTLSNSANLGLTVSTAPPGKQDFTLIVNPSVSVAAGASGTVSLSATGANGFTGPITVALTGLPSGVAASPSTISLVPGTPQTVTFAAAASAAVATTNVTFTGTSGGLSHTAVTALSVTTSSPTGQADFSLALAPATLSVTAGTSGQTMLSVGALKGFTGTVNVAVTGLPAGVTVSPQTTQVSTASPQAFVFAVSSTATAGTATVTFTAADSATGTLTHTATLAFTVVAPAVAPDFALSVNPSSVSISVGGTAQLGLTASPIGGYSGSVKVAISGLPAGVTASPSTPVLTAGLPQFVTLNVSSSAAAGTTTVTFTGTSGTLVHAATLALTIANPPPPADYALGVTPGSLTVAQGSSQTVSVRADAFNGYSAPINVTTAGLLTGVTSSPSTFTLLPGTAQTITISAALNSAMGSTIVSFDGTSGKIYHSALLALNVTKPQAQPDFSLSLSPSSEGITQGQTGQTIAVTATPVNGFSGIVNVTLSGLPSGVDASSMTLTVLPGQPQSVSLTAQATAQVGSSTVTFSGSSGSLTHTANLSLNITAPLTPGYDVTTYHYDAARSGTNPSEPTLTPANVNSANFGRLGSLAVDGSVDAQPLYVSDLLIYGQDHNVLYAVTENDTVYAFDADNPQASAPLWKTSVLATGEVASDDHGCNDITPQIGITATPVIDRRHGSNGTIFLVAMSKDTNGVYHQRLHALDLITGKEVQGSPTEITGSFPGNGVTSQNGSNVFDPSQYAERASLLLQNGTIYMGWASHCDQAPYAGWLMAYSESTLQQTAVLNLAPNGSGGAISMSGGGIAADSSGNVYMLAARGTFDTTLNGSNFPGMGDFGNSFLKIGTGTGMSVSDYFEPYNGPTESTNNLDLGTGGVVMLPDITLPPPIGTFHLMAGAGKDGNVYIVSRDSMGKYNSSRNNVFLTLPNAVPNGEYGSPAYFNNVLYYGGASDNLKAFAIVSSRPGPGGPGSPTSKSANSFAAPGTTPSVSAKGTANAIVWALESNIQSPAVLHAYDATNLATELYNSNQAAGGRDGFGNGNGFVTPMVANGKVYVGTSSSVAIFGILQ